MGAPLVLVCQASELCKKALQSVTVKLQGVVRFGDVAIRLVLTRQALRVPLRFLGGRAES